MERSQAVTDVINQQRQQSLKNTRINELFTEALKSTPFPVDRLSQKWKEGATAALEHASPISLGVNAETFKKVALQSPWRKEFALTMEDFALLSNNLEARSPKELDLPIGEYVELVMEAGSHAAYWNEERQRIIKEIEAKVDAEFAAKEMAAKSLKAVKAEA